MDFLLHVWRQKSRDAAGRMLIQKESTDGNAIFDLREYAAGIYFIEIKGDDVMQFEKIIIQKH